MVKKKPSSCEEKEVANEKRIPPKLAEVNHPSTCRFLVREAETPPSQELWELVLREIHCARYMHSESKEF